MSTSSPALEREGVSIYIIPRLNKYLQIIEVVEQVIIHSSVNMYVVLVWLIRIGLALIEAKSDLTPHEMGVQSGCGVHYSLLCHRTCWL